MTAALEQLLRLLKVQLSSFAAIFQGLETKRVQDYRGNQFTQFFIRALCWSQHVGL